MWTRGSGLGDSRRIEVPKEGGSFVGLEDRSGYAGWTLSPNSVVVQHGPVENMGLETGGSVCTLLAYQ